MISHEQALAQFDAYFGNRLSREETRAFHAHINDCEDCRVRLRAMRAAAPAPGFTLRGAPGQDERLQAILRKNRIIMLAITAVMVCFFFLFLMKRR